ncbi:MAG: molybdopterin cofactor-binding domain-containing protein, partial [Myxococcota bacterium]|nr:molybdopterin cofactor-binding domain-containing protein [Myxococcota bacterium]
MAERESPLRKSLKHESGRLHVSGKARYVDDFPAPAELLYAKPIMATEAHAKILSIDLERARGLAGVHAILLAEDIPGLNDASPFAHDEPLLADGMVHCMGQAIGLVVAETEDICFDAMARIEVEYETLDPILTIRDAIEVDSILGEVQVIERGDVDKLLERAAIRLSGEVESGGQDHFYLETHAAQALPDDRGGFHVQSSTQHPSEVQAKVAELLNLGRHEVVVSCPRMGGAFGGKETQAARVAEYAALAAHHTGRPVRVRLNRDEDMIHTGKRHPWYSRYDVGFDHRGVLLALDVQTYADGGWATDLSGAILQRCLFHLDHAYFVPAARFVGKVARTNTVSNTAFRGFGGPQGALVIESILNDVAEALELDPAEVRRRNFYGPSPRHVTPYGQVVTPDDNRLERIYDELMLSSSYSKRRLAIQAFNANSEWVKRGIGFQPVKFGISFTTSMLNQAGALVLVYADGTVQLNHGGTEMGQGLHTKMLAICAHELGVELEAIRVMDTATDKVPNTSATAA